MYFIQRHYRLSNLTTNLFVNGTLIGSAFLEIFFSNQIKKNFSEDGEEGKDDKDTGGNESKICFLDLSDDVYKLK